MYALYISRYIFGRNVSENVIRRHSGRNVDGILGAAPPRKCGPNAESAHPPRISSPKCGRNAIRGPFRTPSPGALPNHMTVESVRASGRPRSRNELMVNAVVAARLMERRGRGWLIMRQAMAEHGLPEPEIENGPVARVVRVTLWRSAEAHRRGRHASEPQHQPGKGPEMPDAQD